MPVIINEFEIITSAPPKPEGQTQAPPREEPSPRLRPQDIERIVQHERQRRERVRAD